MDLATTASTPRLHRDYSESDRLAARITELYAYITVANGKLLALIREFDEKEYWAGEGINSCAHWLNWACGIGMNAAREKVRVARALGSLPKIRRAFERGEVSYSKVRAMTRTATLANEDFLLNIARHGTAYHTERLISHYRRVNRLQEAEDAQKQYQNREVFTRWGEDGTLVVNARLPSEQGALLVKALELGMERLYQEDVSAETPKESSRVPARRADALAALAESYLDEESPDSSAGDRFQVVVHVSAETLRSPAPEISHLEDGPRVSAETSRRMACDSGVVKIFKDENGEALSIGRKSRSIPPAIRRALKLRDGGCRFPGCTLTRFVDGHHIRHWADGGETSLDNLVLLCRRHHRLVHEGGFDCRRHAGQVVFRSPRGNVLPPAAIARPSLMAEEPDAWISRHADCRHIDSGTIVTRWDGENMDWHEAVGQLCDAGQAARQARLLT